MKSNVIIGALGMALAMSACSTVQHTATTAPVDTQVYNLTVAELDVAEKKAEKTYEWSWNPFRSLSLEREKQNVTAAILDEANADVLVEPQFEISRRGLFRGGSLTVTGFPAKYKNFHAMTHEEAEIVAISNGTYNPGATINPCGVLAATQPQPKTNAKSSKKVMPVSIFNKRPLTLRETTAGRCFVTLMGGVFTMGDASDLQHAFQFGAMVGKHGYHWGKYAKVMFNRAVEGGENLNSAQLTFGTIYRPSGVVGIYGGIGVGNYFDYRGHEYEKINNDFAIPVELGLQINLNRNFHLTVGAGVPIHVDYVDDTYLNVMGGIGYTF